MKLKLICLAVLLCLVLSMPVSAVSGMTVHIDDKEFSVWDGGDNTAVAKILSVSPEELAGYCEDNHMIYMALNSDNKKQVRISADTTDFSESAGNLSYFDEEKTDIVAKKLCGENPYSIIDKNGQRFIRTELSLNDSGGVYSTVQYITVAGKKLYTMSFFTSGNSDKKYINEFFNGWQCDDFTVSSAEKLNGTLKTVIIAAAVLLLAFAGFILYTVIRDVKASKSTNENNA